jgi:hypothetical protein
MVQKIAEKGTINSVTKIISGREKSMDLFDRFESQEYVTVFVLPHPRWHNVLHDVQPALV